LLASGEDDAVKPLVFLHGWAQSQQVWHKQRDSFPNALYLNLPGHGGADDVPVDHWIDELAQQLPEKPCVLAGWSLGGILALALTSRFPERIAALALISTTPCFRRRLDWQPGCDERQFAEFEAAVASKSPRLLNRFFALMLHGDALSRSDYNALAKQAVDSQQPVSAAGLSGGLELLDALDYRHAMADIAVPTLILHGEADAIVSAESGRWLAESIQHSQMQLFPACGHAIFMTQSEKFNQYLSNWWSSL